MAVIFFTTSGAAAGPLPIMPDDRFAAARLTLEYERPWPGLGIRAGSVSGGLSFPRGILFGARFRDLEAPTVRQTALGGWARIGRWVFVGADRVEVRVDGIEPLRRIDLELAGRLVRGPLAVGWAATAEDVASDGRAVWRHWWVTLRRGGLEFSASRRVIPWRVAPDWGLGIRFVLTGSVDAALGWREREARVALSFPLPSSRITAETVWSGARAGAFTFRLETGLP